MEQYQNKTRNFFNNFCNMQPGNPYDYNMKMDKETLLNKITASIMIEFHEHPLFSCYTPQRARNFQFWSCNQCGCNYNYNVPSFYCTACDYDFCQKCLMQCKLFTIQMYDYSKREFIDANMSQSQLNTNAHNHKMALIQIENYNQDDNYVIHCKSCKCDISNKAQFYYCSLCNFYICQNCFANPKNFNSAFNPYNPGQNYNPNQFSGNNIRNNGQNFNGFNGNQNNNYNNNGNYNNNNNNFNNNNNNGNQGYNNFPNNNNRKDFTNNSGAGGIDFGQNIFNNQINNSNNSNNNNNYGNNINNNQPFNNINNMQNNDVSNNSINSNKTNTSAIINNLVANNQNKIDNNQINNNIPNNNKDKTHQNEDDQIDTYLSGNQLQFKQNHQNNQ